MCDYTPAMRILLAAVLTAASAFSGCASNSSSDSDKVAPAPIDERDSAALRDATYVEGSLPVGSAITIQYEREAKYTRVPYLAVEIVADAVPVTDAKAAELQEITVKGNFPGTPRLLVVDDQFRILASATTSVKQADGSQLATTLAPRQGTRMVIVHDALWSMPMSYEVRVGK